MSDKKSRNKALGKLPVVPVKPSEYDLGDYETFLKRREILSGKKYSKGSKKPIKAVLGVLALGALGAKALSKATKKTATATPNDTEYVSNKKNMVTDLYQKATGDAKMKLGGEVEVGKGGDYIKDLID